MSHGSCAYIVTQINLSTRHGKWNQNGLLSIHSAGQPPKSWPDAPSQLSRTPVAAVQAARESLKSHCRSLRPLDPNSNDPTNPSCNLLSSSHWDRPSWEEFTSGLSLRRLVGAWVRPARYWAAVEGQEGCCGGALSGSFHQTGFGNKIAPTTFDQPHCTMHTRQSHFAQSLHTLCDILMGLHKLITTCAAEQYVM